MNSGSPTMTVNQTGLGPTSRLVQCSWFSGNELAHGEFEPGALMFADSKLESEALLVEDSLAKSEAKRKSQDLEYDHVKDPQGLGH